ncbi:MAG: chromosome segregation protein SMC [bacterium]|nr:chromosome segregation protein SMC [bacterium]
MRLKRLVARGFKSFADRTEFEFDTRLTGIIGPNGCGKSNVVDAIKWVLGDQRAKSLRGSAMTDVIFKGAEGRAALGMAEVTITFEDPNAGDGERSEIDISRRLTVDKESSYLLNGEQVRLKDVRDELLDTGLGTGGYSVMEQGRIDAVLSANPEARRAIFEEAAGISRFKLQKKEALRKLDRTDQNLSRATDLLEERARRIRSLRIQAGKARRWRELHAQLRDLRAALAVLDGRRLRAETVKIRDRLAELDTELAAAEEGGRASAAELGVRDDAIVTASNALEEVQAELATCHNELTSHRERAEAQGQRSGDLEAEIGRGRQRVATLEEQQQERRTDLTSAQGELVQRESELIELHRELEGQRGKVQESLDALRELAAERERLRARQLDLLHRRTRAKNTAADAEARIAAVVAREQRLQERTAVLGNETVDIEREVGTWRERLTELGTRERILGEREHGAIADLEVADAAAAELAQRERDLRLELSQVEGRQQALQAMEAHMEGLDEAPRYVLQQQPEGLRGRLLDLIEIDLEHGVALEAALGPFVQALVVDTREHAAAIVRDLADKRLGRVLLLVEEAFGERPTGISTLLSPPEGASYLTSLVRHVFEGEGDSAGAGDAKGGRAGSERLMAWLLRGVVLADFDIADSARADLCFVTPDGTLVCGPRMEGGAVAEGHAGLVVRKSQIIRLGEEAAELQARLDSQKVDKDTAATRVDRLKRELKQLGTGLQAARRARQECEGEINRLAARRRDVEAELAELALEAAELTRTRCGALARLGVALFDQFLLTRKEQVEAAADAALDERHGAAEAATKSLQAEEQELRLRQVQAGEAREGHVRSIRMHEEALADFERAMHEIQDRLHDAESDRDRAQGERERLLELASHVEERAQELETQKGERQAALDAARSERTRVQQEVHEWEQKRSLSNEMLTQAKLSLADVDHRFTRLEDRLREETALELLRCLGEVHGVGLVDHESLEGPDVHADLADQVDVLQGPPLPPADVKLYTDLVPLWEQEEFDATETKKEVKVLQSQKDRLGAVNLDAVAELEAEEGEFGNTEQEVQDLKDARRALLETLKKLEVESRTLFEATFHAARKNFQELFRKLFQGGRADMFLGESEDMLDAGIEIVAQPPGKQLQSINLLSGGERSLTAVAILFALFKVRPSPFCILDEVDAALDDTNVERFLRVLREFVDNTQFCIVTHHKRTMAECQVLYGITMQRRGISSRIAVAMHEIDSFQDGGAADAGDSKPAGENPASKRGGVDPALKQRIAGEEQVGFS